MELGISPIRIIHPCKVRMLVTCKLNEGFCLSNLSTFSGLVCLNLHIFCSSLPTAETEVMHCLYLSLGARTVF